MAESPVRAGGGDNIKNTVSPYSGTHTSIQPFSPGSIGEEEEQPRQLDVYRSWLADELQARNKDFTEPKDVKVFCGTWNVNAKKPTEDIGLWLKGSKAIVDNPPDLYAIGFQEIVDLNAHNLVVDHNANDVWEETVAAALPGDYIKLATKHLVGVSLVVFVRKDKYTAIRQVRASSIGVGIMGVGGNKGGVAIRLRMYDSTIVFVNSHLAAHQSNSAGRNSDFHSICKKLTFIDKDDKNIKTAATANTKKAYEKDGSTIMEHDKIFWIGDLNYRLTCTDLDAVYKRIDVMDYKFLLEHDQLLIEKKAGRCFDGFEEAPVTFAPTYKYQPGTPLYERREDKKKRFPAWCDRVQWKGEGIKVEMYNRAELHCSDHKPVYALFQTIMHEEIPEKKKEVEKDIARERDALENEKLPMVNISSLDLKFKDVRFGIPKTKLVRVSNVGKGFAEFSFKGDSGKPFLQNGCGKPYVTVEPDQGLIRPGQSVDITVTIEVMNTTGARAFTEDDEKLRDILILSLVNGREHFIELEGNYLKSCFGCSLMYLGFLDSPIRTTPAFKLDSKQSPVLKLPKEAWRLVDALYNPPAHSKVQSGLATPSLFVAAGDRDEIEKIRECLDIGDDFGDWSPYSYAHVLIQFLENLCEPVFPGSLIESYKEDQYPTTWCRIAMTKLTPPQYHMFVYIVALLREVLAHEKDNGLTPLKLITVFVPCLMHTGEVVPEVVNIYQKHLMILHHFLTSEEFV